MKIIPAILICILLPLCPATAQHISLPEKMAREGYALRFTDTARSIRLQQNALKQAVTKEDQAICYAYMALTYRRLLDLDNFSLYANSAYTIADSIKSPRASAYASLAMGLLGSYIEDNQNAIIYLLKAYGLFSRSNDYDHCSRIAADISYLFSPNSPVKVRKYATEAVEYATRAGDPESILHARLAMGGCLRDELQPGNKKQWLEDYAFFHETIAGAEQHEAQIVSKSNIGAAYINMADLLNAAPPPTDEQAALTCLDKASRIARQYNLKNIYRTSIGIKGEYYMDKGDFHTAERLFMEGINYQRTLPYRDHYLMSSFYQSLKKLALRQQDYKAYYGYDTAFLRYNKLRNDESTQKMLQYADARFESEKKLTRIRQLEDENKLQQKNKLLGYGIAGIFFIGLVFMYSAYYFRQRYHAKRADFIDLKMQLMEKESMEHLAQKLSLERRLLRSQMDPHFIFNALGNIQSMILQKETAPAVSYLSKFAKLTRQVLEHSRMETITLDEEINSLKHYIELQQLRLNNAFTYRIECDEDVDTSTQIPPLLVQPFVENAIEHGLKPLIHTPGCLLTITFRESSDAQHMICTITDNGIGLTASKLRRTDRTHRSMSTTITGERLEQMQKHHPDAGFEIYDRTEAGDGKGCIVTLRIPINQHV
jgi:signal transduction histidine kinase